MWGQQRLAESHHCAWFQPAQMNSCWMNKTPTWFNGPLLKFEAYWVQEILNSLAQSTLSSFSSTIFQGLIQSPTPLKLAPSPIPTPKVLSPPSGRPWNISALRNKLACCLTSPIPLRRPEDRVQNGVIYVSSQHLASSMAQKIFFWIQGLISLNKHLPTPMCQALRIQRWLWHDG